MKDNRYFLNTALAVVLGASLLVCVLFHTFAPEVVLPKLDIPNMVLISLVSLLAENYLASGKKRSWIFMGSFSALTFGLLPLAAGFAEPIQALKLAVIGGVAFMVSTWLYDSIRERLGSGPVAKAAPVLSALGLYLAAQCFAGMVF